MMLKSILCFNRMQGIALLLCFSVQLLGQHSISKYERCWALWHPIAALKIKKQLYKLSMEQKRMKFEWIDFFAQSIKDE